MVMCDEMVKTKCLYIDGDGYWKIIGKYGLDRLAYEVELISDEMNDTHFLYHHDEYEGFVHYVTGLVWLNEDSTTLDLIDRVKKHREGYDLSRFSKEIIPIDSDENSSFLDIKKDEPIKIKHIEQFSQSISGKMSNNNDYYKNPEYPEMMYLVEASVFAIKKEDWSDKEEGWPYVDGAEWINVDRKIVGLSFLPDGNE